LNAEEEAEIEIVEEEASDDEVIVHQKISSRSWRVY